MKVFFLFLKSSALCTDYSSFMESLISMSGLISVIVISEYKDELSVHSARFSEFRIVSRKSSMATVGTKRVILRTRNNCFINIAFNSTMQQYLNTCGVVCSITESITRTWLHLHIINIDSSRGYSRVNFKDMAMRLEDLDRVEVESTLIDN